MDKLLQEWQQYLQEFEEKRYGEEYKQFKQKSIQLFSKLYDAAKGGVMGREKMTERFLQRTQQLADENFQEAGMGASRKAYKMPDGSILKVARNDAGIEDNEEEFKLTRSQFSDILLQVEDMGPQAEYPAWIVTEEVDVFKGCAEMVFSFPMFARQRRKVINFVDDQLSSLCAFFQVYLLVGMVDYAKNPEADFEEAAERVVSKFPAGFLRQKAKDIAKFYRNTYDDASENLRQMVRFVTRHPANLMEYGPRNLGEDSQGNTVFVDPSTTAHGTQIGLGRYLTEKGRDV